MNTALTPHLFWITSRAAGFAALVLASLAVSLGLLMSTKLLKGRTTDLRAAHDTLALATIVAIVVHGVSLLGDSFLHPSIFDISIPFVSSYKTIWTTLGIVGGWGLIALGLSYYARRWVGAVRWRKLHRFTALAWLSDSCTRSARARTPASCGSWRWWRSWRFPRWLCSPRDWRGAARHPGCRPRPSLRCRRRAPRARR